MNRNMIRIAAAALAVAAGLSVTAALTTAPAYAEPTTTNELAFVTVLEDHGIITRSSEDAAIALGYQVCNGLASGLSPAKVVSIIDLPRSGYFVGASIAAFCPQYGSLPYNGRASLR